jgi:hypothetical protein
MKGPGLNPIDSLLPVARVEVPLTVLSLALFLLMHFKLHTASR